LAHPVGWQAVSELRSKTAANQDEATGAAESRGLVVDESPPTSSLGIDDARNLVARAMDGTASRRAHIDDIGRAASKNPKCADTRPPLLPQESESTVRLVFLVFTAQRQCRERAHM